MLNKRFLRDLGERAIKTFVQTAGPFFAGAAAGAVGGWTQFLLMVAAPTGLSILSSFASARVGDEHSASALPAVDL